MIIFEYTEDINIDTAHISDELSDILYFDIETTGLSAKRSDLYLIGCSYFSDSAFRTQLIFNDNGTSEPEMLSHFEQILKNHKILVSYNGDTFDIPYLLKKMEQFDVDTTLDNIQSVDIYRTTRKYKKLLRLDSAKQFDIEHLIDFQRNTFISGGDLISAYKHYLSSHDESLLDDMLTHNHDDIRGLISISEFVNIPHIPDDFQIDDISDTIDSITYNCSIPKLPCRITESLNGILVNACDTHMHVVVPKTRDTEMKYFFKDYKNYYYLPMEHMAIHKSMAAYVDDAHKEKATKDNAFTTKTGSFIPCPPGFHGEIFYDTDLKGNRFLSDSTELHEKCEQSHAYILAVLNKLF